MAARRAALPLTGVQIAPSALEPSPANWHIGPPNDPSGQFDAPGPPRRRPRRLGTLLVTMLVVAGASAAGVLVAANRRVDEIQRIVGLGAVLSPSNPNVENYLLVGSDVRDCATTEQDSEGICGADAPTDGGRSDTIMILRRDKTGGPISLMSLPRDLWLDIPGRDGPNRINAAYRDGADVLIRTVTETLQIPIHHYIEVNFEGFKTLVDALGGVEICFDLPARDTHTGFYVAQPGCQVLDGVQGLAYARSRFYEEYVNGGWVADPRSDLSRIERQQKFINIALQAAIATVKANPLKAGDVLGSSTTALRIDDGLDVLQAAAAIREAVGTGLQTYSPPVTGKTINGNAVLLPGDGFLNYIQFFSGQSNTPPVPA